MVACCFPNKLIDCVIVKRQEASRAQLNRYCVDPPSGGCDNYGLSEHRHRQRYLRAVGRLHRHIDRICLRDHVRTANDVNGVLLRQHCLRSDTEGNSRTVA